MSDKNRWENLDHLKPNDEIKFVIASRRDFDWAIDCIKINNLEKKCNLLMSVAFGLLKEQVLVEWILAEGVNVRLNLQQHKYIWSPRQKGLTELSNLQFLNRLSRVECDSTYRAKSSFSV